MATIRRALLSDIHGNIEAFRKVMADVREQLGPDAEAYNLGDLIGYGPNPIGCIDLAENFFTEYVRGNHDHGVLTDPGDDFAPHAHDALCWTRQQLNNSPREAKLWKYLEGSSPNAIVRDGIMYAHGSPRSRDEYIDQKDVYTNRKKLRTLFEMFDWLCFFGHTHIPAVFSLESLANLEEIEYEMPGDLPESGYEIIEGQGKAMINVGSVGQPRDRDSRACYVILEVTDDTPRKAKVQWRRVAYSVKKTRAKIFRHQELDRFLGERLLEGR